MTPRVVLEVMVATPAAAWRQAARGSTGMVLVLEIDDARAGWSVSARTQPASLACTLGHALTSRLGVPEARLTVPRDEILRVAVNDVLAAEVMHAVEEALFAARTRGLLIVCTPAPRRWLRTRSALATWVRRVTRTAGFRWEQGAELLRWHAVRGATGCDTTIVRWRETTVDVFHACTNERFEVPTRALPILVGTKPAPRERSALFAALGIDHDSPQHGTEAPALVRDRAEHRVTWAAQNVRAYRDCASFAAVPIRTPREVAARFEDYLQGGRTLASLTQDRRVLLRSSGGTTTGKPRVLVVERALRAERADAENLLWGRVREPRIAIVNRPGNLFGVPIGFDEVRVGSERPGELRVTPGMNPTRIPRERWAEVHAALADHAPEVVYGEANYLVGLAHYMRAHGRSLPSVREVVLGFQLAWSFQRRFLASVFGTTPRDLYHSGEASAMGISCARGQLHLLEVHALYELLRGRRAGAPVPLACGERGLLVLSLLDTRIQPLLRYAIGDIVRLRATSCTCGRPGRVIELEGRLRHSFIDGRGRVVTPRKLDAVVDRALRALGLDLHALQVRRDGRGLTLSCVASRSARPAIAQLAEHVGAAFALAARGRVVAAVPLAAPNGKLLTHDVPDEEDRLQRAILDGTIRW